ncbi:hypothetical protein F0562_009940 [Nyssa sinensis]|uniref:25S rRNA (uridine-N(3))-methyltransferase BMT5-like domain-containing protein n=1 Tax=Nyssa sinensis TaxID=561372 RepID=A0A5J5A2G0_9ASTE|nr:hypothetical protein F0562_009940 [Nyssa sinensis]
MTLRAAAVVSNTGFLGLMARNIIKVAIPKKMRRRLNIRHSIAAHHTSRLVRRGCGSIGCSLAFLMPRYGESDADVCCFIACFDITIWLRGVSMASSWGGDCSGGGGERVSIFRRCCDGHEHDFILNKLRNINERNHQCVVKGFLRSARDMLKENGEVHVTHKTAYPFSEWKIEESAEEMGLRLVEKAWFSKWDYPGYDNKRGDGTRSNETFPVGECSTFKFAKP